MKGCLRSWKLCRTIPEIRDGVPGWRKQRSRRAALLIPPGNLVLRLLDSGLEMVGSGWADHEAAAFRRAHPEALTPCRLDDRTIWLPHLLGVPLRAGCPEANRERFHAAFSELGRFHRSSPEAAHGDPHMGNFLFDEVAGRCRIIDFETALAIGMPAAEGRARDFAILALDLWRSGMGTAADFASWRRSYGGEESDCPVASLLRAPSPGLRAYWYCLGYRIPADLGSRDRRMWQSR